MICNEPLMEEPIDTGEWKPIRLVEGVEEVWITFYSEKLDREYTMEICSVEDLIYDKIGDKDAVKQRIEEEIGDGTNWSGPWPQ